MGGPSSPFAAMEEMRRRVLFVEQKIEGLVDGVKPD